MILKGNQRGEITSILTITSLAIMAAGLILGSFASRSQDLRSRTKAQDEEAAPTIVEPPPEQTSGGGDVPTGTVQEDLTTIRGTITTVMPPSGGFNHLDVEVYSTGQQVQKLAQQRLSQDYETFAFLNRFPRYQTYRVVAKAVNDNPDGQGVQVIAQTEGQIYTQELDNSVSLTLVVPASPSTTPARVTSITVTVTVNAQPTPPIYPIEVELFNENHESIQIRQLAQGTGNSTSFNQGIVPGRTYNLEARVVDAGHVLGQETATVYPQEGENSYTISIDTSHVERVRNIRGTVTVTNPHNLSYDDAAVQSQDVDTGEYFGYQLLDRDGGDFHLRIPQTRPNQRYVIRALVRRGGEPQQVLGETETYINADGIDVDREEREYSINLTIELPPTCRPLLREIEQGLGEGGVGSSCGAQNYTPVADIDDDGQVNSNDRTYFNRHSSLEWCSEQLRDDTNVCASIQGEVHTSGPAGSTEVELFDSNGRSLGKRWLPESQTFQFRQGVRNNQTYRIEARALATGEGSQVLANASQEITTQAGVNTVRLEIPLPTIQGTVTITNFSGLNLSEVYIDYRDASNPNEPNEFAIKRIQTSDGQQQFSLSGIDDPRIPILPNHQYILTPVARISNGEAFYQRPDPRSNPISAPTDNVSFNITIPPATLVSGQVTVVNPDARPVRSVDVSFRKVTNTDCGGNTSDLRGQGTGSSGQFNYLIVNATDVICRIRSGDQYSLYAAVELEDGEVIFSPADKYSTVLTFGSDRHQDFAITVPRLPAPTAVPPSATAVPQQPTVQPTEGPEAGCEFGNRNTCLAECTAPNSCQGSGSCWNCNELAATPLPTTPSSRRNYHACSEDNHCIVVPCTEGEACPGNECTTDNSCVTASVATVDLDHNGAITKEDLNQAKALYGQTVETPKGQKKVNALFYSLMLSNL